CVLVVAAFWQPTSQAQAPVSFANDIQPILENSCWGCHGPKLQLSNLDLSSRDGALQGGTRGPALVPGRADDSRLYRLVAGLEKPGMPLKGSLLTPTQIATIKTWIDEGAHWDATTSGAVVKNSAPPDPGASLENAELPAGARDYWAFKLPV